MEFIAVVILSSGCLLTCMAVSTFGMLGNKPLHAGIILMGVILILFGGQLVFSNLTHTCLLIAGLLLFTVPMAWLLRVVGRRFDWLMAWILRE